MKKGIAITYVLVFGSIFLILLAGLLTFVLMQLKISNQKIAWNHSLHIAEAGIDYYRWCINNEADEDCIIEQDYLDAEGNSIGHFSLEIDPTVFCGQTIQRKISSTGWTNDFPQIKREISIIYARESVAKYSYILNDDVWVGSDHKINGPYHSNGGVRMDGENQSLFTSGKENWICTNFFGCDICPVDDGCVVEEDNCVCPGILTTTQNSNPGLFDFPIPAFDFTGITIDLAQIKDITEYNLEEYYWPVVTTINSNGEGYHLKFLNNGSFEVWIITDLAPTNAYSIEEGWHYDYFTITNEYYYKTVFINEECPLIFIEDNLWIQGEIKDKVTVASANLIDPNLDTDIILLDNIDYTTDDGSDGLALIGQRNILIGPQSPNTMQLKGIFIAQKGRFSRNHYPNNFRDSLEILGSIISKGRVGTKWTSGSQIVSGYLNRESYHDLNLVYESPPFVPYLNPDFKLMDWREK